MLNSGSQDATQFAADDFTNVPVECPSDLNSSVSAAGSVTAAALTTTRSPGLFSGWLGSRCGELQKYTDLPAHGYGRDHGPGR